MFDYILEFLRDGTVTVEQPTLALLDKLRREFRFFALPIPSELDEIEARLCSGFGASSRRQPAATTDGPWWKCANRSCGIATNYSGRTPATMMRTTMTTLTSTNPAGAQRKPPKPSAKERDLNPESSIEPLYPTRICACEYHFLYAVCERPWRKFLETVKSCNETAVEFS